MSVRLDLKNSIVLFFPLATLLISEAVQRAMSVQDKPDRQLQVGMIGVNRCENIQVPSPLGRTVSIRVCS